MKWNKSARLLAVAGLALASSVAWGQYDTTYGGATTTDAITGLPTATGVTATNITGYSVTPTSGGNSSTGVSSDTPIITVGTGNISNAAAKATNADNTLYNTTNAAAIIAGTLTAKPTNLTGSGVNAAGATLTKDGSIAGVTGVSPGSGGVGGGRALYDKAVADYTAAHATWAAADPATRGSEPVAPATLSAIVGMGLAGTDHDFTGRASTGNGTAIGLCSFCHTPHKAKSTLLLWNHTLSANTFQWDVAATTSGTKLPGFTGNAYNGPSAKCLSCHDGSVAIGDVGWFDEKAQVLNTFQIGKDNDTTKQVGKGGNLGGTHPVAIPYPLMGSPGVYNGSTTGAQLASDDFVADPSQNNIRLYSDVGGGAIVGKAQVGSSGIECSSCHDPHNKAATDDKFLRGKMAGNTAGGADGYICLACHKK